MSSSGPALGVRLSGNVLPQPLWRLRSGFSSLVPHAGPVEGDDGPVVDVVSALIGGWPALVLLVALVVVLGALGWVLHRRQQRTRRRGVLGRRRRRPRRPGVPRRWSPSGSSSPPTTSAGCGPSAVLVNVVVLWAVAELVAHRWRGAVAAVSIVPIALATVLSVAAVPYHAQPQGPVADYAAMPALRRVFRELEPLRAGEPVVYDITSVRVSSSRTARPS